MLIVHEWDDLTNNNSYSVDCVYLFYLYFSFNVACLRKLLVKSLESLLLYDIVWLRGRAIAATV